MRLLIIGLMLSACGAPNADNVAGVSRNEAEALNDAAEMLDDNAGAPVHVENATQAP